MKKRKSDDGTIRMPLPRRGEMFAVVDKVLGGSRMDVSCDDGKERMARIPGRKRRRMGRIRMGDLLIVSPWDVQDEKADVLYRYKRNQARFLSNRGMLPERIDVF